MKKSGQMMYKASHVEVINQDQLKNINAGLIDSIFMGYIISNRAHWPIIPALWEAKMGGSPEVGSSRPA